MQQNRGWKRHKCFVPFCSQFIWTHEAKINKILWITSFAVGVCFQFLVVFQDIMYNSYDIVTELQTPTGHSAFLAPWMLITHWNWNPFLPSFWSQVSWSLFQLALGSRRGTPWTGCQPIEKQKKKWTWISLWAPPSFSYTRNSDIQSICSTKILLG